ncbi:MAG: stage II sporulation protein M [Firmicutes bacterium]|nr:stage II sporulation protein M [Bacillota bacterium]
MPTSGRGIRQLARAIQALAPYLLLTAGTFLLAAAAGALALTALAPAQAGEVAAMVDGFRRLLDSGQAPAAVPLFAHALVGEVRLLLLLCALGFTAYGAPLVLLLVALRGADIGFTVAALVARAGWPGLVMAGTAVLPQNLLAIPIWLLVSAAACHSSMLLLRRHLPLGGRHLRRREPLPLPLLTVLGAVGLAGVSAVQAFLALPFARAVLALL